MSDNNNKNTKSRNETAQQEKPLMNDEQAAEYRRRLVRAGVITERNTKDGSTNSDELNTYRNRLIAEGLLKPGNGKYRPRPKIYRTSKGRS